MSEAESTKMNSDPPLRRGTRARKKTERYVHPDHGDLFRKDMQRHLPEEEVQGAIDEAFAAKLIGGPKPGTEWSPAVERASREEEARDLRYLEDPEGAARVCRVRKGDIYPAYDSLREWMADPDNVYIGQGGAVLLRGTDSEYLYPGEDSIWASPFRGGDTGRYRRYIEQKIREDPETYDLEKLRGKRLGCWCAPQACHGDVLLELLVTSCRRRIR